MIQKVLLPKLGDTVERAVIETWHKKEGERVDKGDVLCEITTDKATFEVESDHRGTLLKIVAGAGIELPVNSLIAVIGDPGEAIPSEALAAPAAGEKKAGEPAAAASARVEAEVAAGAAGPVEAPGSGAGRAFASPRARKLAAGEHVPLTALRGSGPNGRIVEGDVKAYVARLEEARVTPVARKAAYERGVDVLALAASGRKVTKEDVLGAPAVSAAAAPPRALKAGRVKLTPMRRVIAERMAQSKREAPCYYLHIDVDMTDLMECRRKLNAKGPEKISVNDYVVVACGRGLAEFPDCNTRWDGDGIVYRGEANVGIAVALDQGLIVPVIRNVERKTLRQVAAESERLVEKARSRKLAPAEFEGGCLTVSNLGMFGVKHFIPIVNPGESCIVGLGVIEDRVVVRQGGIHIRKMMTMTMSLDHRLIDGAVGARFAERVRDLLEHPAELEK